MIECHIRAAPAPTIEWIKDAIDIKIGGRYRVTHEGSTYQLLISKPSFADTGKYVCRAENSAAKVEMGHFVMFEGKETHLHVAGIFHAQRRTRGLSEPRTDDAVEEVTEEGGAREGEIVEGEPKKKVKGKPGTKGGKGVSVMGKPGLKIKKQLSFASSLKDRIIFTGQTLKLCLTCIGPEPQIKWMRNGCGIVYGPHIKNFTKEGYACIEVYNVTEEDAGEYSCVAKNAAGEISTSGRITVYTSNQSDASAAVFLLPLRGKRQIYVLQVNFSTTVRLFQPTQTIIERQRMTWCSIARCRATHRPGSRG